jgi:hypothetical protein
MEIIVYLVAYIVNILIVGQPLTVGPSHWRLFEPHVCKHSAASKRRQHDSRGRQAGVMCSCWMSAEGTALPRTTAPIA